MSTISRSIMLVASLLVVPAGFASAESNDHPCAQDCQVHAAVPAGRLGTASDPTVPGATGRTIIVGSSSTVAGDAAATEMQRTGSLSR